MSSSPTPAAPVLPFFYYNPPYVATAVTALVLFAVLGAIATWNFVKEKPRSKTHINIIVFCVCTCEKVLACSFAKTDRPWQSASWLWA